MESRIFVLKILILFIIMSFFIISIGIKFLIGKEIVEIYGVPKKTLSKIFGICIILLGIYLSYDIFLDFTEFNVQEVKITVERINNPGIQSIIRNDIVTKENGIYLNMFKKYKFNKNKVYLLKYLPRTKIIVDSLEISNLSR